MRRSLLWTVLAILTLVGRAGAQIIYLPPGSTPQGDYLRGLGFAAMGLGALEVDNAVTTSINTNTAIRWNEYVSSVVAHTAQNYRQRVLRAKELRNKLLGEIQKRIREQPEELDVLKGDALNALKDQLLDPGVSDSAFRYAVVRLPVDIVRRIPFKLGRESLTFSMERLTARGKDQWPPALQDNAFAGERRAYEHALDTVLEQQSEGKMELATIEHLGTTIQDLFRKLNQVLTPSQDKLYMEAKRRIDDFKRSYEFMVKSHNSQKAIGELDRYWGTSVRELLLFMQRHNLSFGTTETPAERALYPQLYAWLREQQELLKLPPDAPAP